MGDQQPPPVDLDAEASVLAESMSDDSGVVFDEMRELLVVSDFYSESNKVIYESLCELREAGQPIDLVSVSRRLRDKGKFNPAYFEQISMATPAALNVRAHANSVKDKSRLRQAIAQFTTLRALAYTDHGAAGVQEFLEKAEGELSAIAHSNAGGKLGPLQELMLDVTNAAHAAKERGGDIIGVPTGFIDLDKETSGLHAGEFRIIAARPGIGKTALLLDEAVRVARKGYAVAFFSLEMPRMQLGYRMVSSAGRLPSKGMRAGRLEPDEWKKFSDTVENLRKLPVWIDDTAELTLAQMRARVRRLQAEIMAGKHPNVTQNRIGAVYVDYLQLLLSPERGNKYATRENIVGSISRGLKILAKELDIPMTAAAQLNREVEKRSSKRPQLSDLRESGSMEQDADTVIFIYRDEYYFADSPDKGVAELSIAKQRNGATGTTKLSFTAEFTRFDNLATGQGYVDGIYPDNDPGFIDG
jgi:replicative DNA helicase